MSSSSVKLPAASTAAPPRFKIEVIYCHADGPVRQLVELTEGDSVEAAVNRARFHERFRELDLNVNRVGIFGNLVTAKTIVRPGDRVEVYQPITCDPETVERRDRAGDSEGTEKP